MSSATLSFDDGASQGKRLTKVIYACGFAFVGLEILRHAVLMQMPMGAYHIVGGILSVVLALIVVGIGIQAVREREMEAKWASHLARVVAASIAVQIEVGDPTSGLSTLSGSLLSRLEGRVTSEELEQWKEVTRRAENVEKVLVSLAIALSKAEAPKAASG